MRTRKLLLDTAARLFVDRGYSAVSMQDIAAEARLTKGGVYGHFRSKGQLLVEVIRAKLAERDAVTDYELAAADQTAGIELLGSGGGREIRLLEVDAAAAARHDPDVAAGLLMLYGERDLRIRDAASRLSDPEAAAWLIAVLAAGIGFREAAGSPAPSAERAHRVLAQAVDGLFDRAPLLADSDGRAG